MTIKSFGAGTVSGFNACGVSMADAVSVFLGSMFKSSMFKAVNALH